MADIPGKMAKVMEYVKQDVATIRTGKATPSLVENVMVDAYGGTAKMKVVELATISISDAQSIVISPFDHSIIGEIRRDIEAANLGLTPIIDHEIIRINVPLLTGERRMEFVKMLHRKLEDGRVKIRQLRHDRMSEMKRSFEGGELPEDDKTSLEKELQDLTDKMMMRIEEIGKTKEGELLQV